jgi:hypothetical protein
VADDITAAAQQTAALLVAAKAARQVLVVQLLAKKDACADEDRRRHCFNNAARRLHIALSCNLASWRLRRRRRLTCSHYSVNRRSPIHGLSALSIDIL